MTRLFVASLFMTALASCGEQPKKVYKFPPLSLLQKGKVGGGDSDAHLRATALKLEQTLQNFNVNVTVTNVSCGPSVTRYELQPEQGVKVSKIVGLADDIKLNLGMANAYFKLPTPVVKPYIGAGIGTTFASTYEPTTDISIDIDDTIAYQGMLGITLDIPVIPFNVDVEGRVLYASDLFEYTTEKYDLLQYEGRVKLRYVF